MPPEARERMGSYRGRSSRTRRRASPSPSARGRTVTRVVEGGAALAGAATEAGGEATMVGARPRAWGAWTVRASGEGEVGEGIMGGCPDGVGAGARAGKGRSVKKRDGTKERA